jgi:hypothetical protein
VALNHEADRQSFQQRSINVMQSFQRAFAFFSIVIAMGFLSGCGGPGAPVSGSSDPATESAEAALAPEGEAEPAAEATEAEAGESTEATPAAEEAAES